MIPRIPALAALSLFTAPLLWATPTANPDTFSAVEDQFLTIDATNGVLDNDTGTGALSAILEDDVSNGSLTLNGDGSFTYTPNPNFNGTDTFTYRTSESPSGGQIFTIDENRSSATVAADLDVSGIGSDSDSDTTRLRGTLTALVTPGEAPFSQIHVTDFNVTTAESVALNFRFAFGLAGVNANAAAEGITISMQQPGAASAVDGAGNFNQLQNEVRLVGTVNVAGTGLAAGAVPEGPQTFDSIGNFIDLNGNLSQSGAVLTLTAPIVFNGLFDLDGNQLDLNLTGNLVATSPVQIAELSAPTTVTINVVPVNDAPVVRNDHYTVASNTLLAVPTIIAGGGDQILVATGTAWKYLDDGSDQGSGWAAPDFNDAAWAGGPGPLGYGDNETTTVSFGGDEDAKFITTYFRRNFEVADPGAHGSLTLRLLRDDGAAIYLNGTEIARSNLPPAATSATPADSAVGGAAEDHYFEFPVPASLLVMGTNTIAAEVHQSAPGSSDLSFDLELIRHRTAGGVLANDTDIDTDDTLTATVHAPPASGDLTLAPDGSFTYMPNPGFVGTDTFIYEAQDTNEFVERALIPFGDLWKYLDDGSDQGTTWRTPAFDDSGWASGAGELGYGDPDHVTIVGFGPDPNNKFATTYFRNHFFLGNASELPDDVHLRLVRDDAAAIYLNGTEIYRDSNLVAGALFNTFANPGVVDEDEIVFVSVPLELLVDGKNSLAVEVHQSSATSSDLAFHLALICETPSEGPILPEGSVWKYDDAGNDLGTAWTAAGFDDSLWLSGAGEIGYGDGDETTALPTPGDPKPLTVYFRRSLTIPDASQVQTLSLDLLRDDGAAVYINGTEVLRDNLPGGAAFDTAATNTVNNEGESIYRPFVKIDPTLLQDGENTIAVEVHQASATSSDISFDLRVNASLVASLGIATIEVTGTPFIDTDNDGIDDNWETANGLTVGIDDSGDDDDGDGSTNREEFLALTDPQDPTSLLKIIAVAQASNGDLTVGFSSTPGKIYRLQHSPDLVRFTDVAGAQLTATGAESSFTTTSPGPTSGYLRVSVQ